MFAYAAGSNFDSNAKQWRLFADIMNNIGACSKQQQQQQQQCTGGTRRLHNTLLSHPLDLLAEDTSQDTEHTGLALFFLLHTCVLCTPLPNPPPSVNNITTTPSLPFLCPCHSHGP